MDQQDPTTQAFSERLRQRNGFNEVFELALGIYQRTLGPFFRVYLRTFGLLVLLGSALTAAMLTQGTAEAYELLFNLLLKDTFPSLGVMVPKHVELPSAAGLGLFGLRLVVEVVYGAAMVGFSTRLVLHIRNNPGGAMPGAPYELPPWQAVGSLALAGVLVNLGVLLGLMLLIVPGLILLFRWMVVQQAVADGYGVQEAFARSATLVKGSVWHTVGVVVVAGIMLALFASLVASGLIGGLVGFVGNTNSNPAFGALSYLLVHLVLALGSFAFQLVIAVLYTNLQARQDPEADPLAV